jgi:hypothetical protein
VGKYVTIAVLIWAVASAGAQTPDSLSPKSNLKIMNCKEVFSMSGTATIIVLAYLQAHYRLKDAPPIIDTPKMLADGIQLKEYCDANPQKSVLEAGDDLFGVRL